MLNWKKEMTEHWLPSRVIFYRKIVKIVAINLKSSQKKNPKNCQTVRKSNDASSQKEVHIENIFVEFNRLQ